MTLQLAETFAAGAKPLPKRAEAAIRYELDTISAINLVALMFPCI